MYDPDAPHVSLNISGNRIDIHWSFKLFTQYKEGVERVTCYIPSFDIYFDANSKADASIRSKIVTKMYIDHFLHHSKRGVRDLVLQLHKLGFKAPNDNLVLKRLLKDGKLDNTNFYAPSGREVHLPSTFKNASSVTENAAMAVEC